jgi:hypothetical protein
MMKRGCTLEEWGEILSRTFATLSEIEKAAVRGEATDLNPAHTVQLIAPELGWGTWATWIQ